MDYLRTPDTCFENLPGYPWASHYAQVDDGEGQFFEEGPLIRETEQTRNPKNPGFAHARVNELFAEAASAGTWGDGQRV